MASSIYSNRVRTRGCALVVKDEKLLLVKQKVPTRKEPAWLAPGGEVELGETASDAAKRETLEETGLIIEPTRLVAVHEFIEPPFHAVELYFLSDITGGNLQTGMDPELNNSEQNILKCQFLEIKKLKNLNVFPEFLRNFYDMEKAISKEGVIHFTSV